MAKKLTDDTSDNPRLGFCDFLKMEVVQLTSDSYDEFQPETFNLVMRLKCRDKQQQRYQHEIGKYGPDCRVHPGLDHTPVSCVPHPDAGPAGNATDIYTSTIRTSTAAAFTALTAALSTDIYSATCSSATADPEPGSTAKHAVTAT